jgi:hypothetical protein
MSLPLARRVDADQRQIPMRLLGMMTTHLLDDREHVRLDALGHRALHQSAHGLFVGMNVRRKP